MTRDHVRMGRRGALAGLAGFGLIWAGGLMGARWWQRRRVEAEAVAQLDAPLSAPEAGLRVYHLGHSLVGRDMPAMLAQLAGAGHLHHSQLGWGASLRDHWEPEVPVRGFETENAHGAFRPAREAIGSGAYDAVVLTEMVEIRDAIRHHDSAAYLARWAALAHAANPDVRVYLYETWHHTDDGTGWLVRIDRDLAQHWQGQVQYPAIAASGVPVHLIPAGQVMAAFVRAAEAQGGLADVAGVDDLFTRRTDGTPDTIHINDLGAYLVALTHYAVLYHRDPAGLPHGLRRADGSAATAPTPETAALMQEIVWQVVRSMDETGVAA